MKKGDIWRKDINEHEKTVNIIYIHKSINEFKKGYRPGT
jgi:hypothetical protein